MASDNLELPGLSEPFEENETTTLFQIARGRNTYHVVDIERCTRRLSSMRCGLESI
ncbi:hypothetical protein BofuT4_uP116510.1 [Botrytis cinerea T4]|uniref:Uncharacterized protein n=1 Tax=Botryotinia fuckeliana (strain T4) TaxID=999810 RepID=G2Y0D6_BOTF4|nr:hypothetical protein BofuT4_uP116510.1 [Botrytis cinerea T4]